MNQPLMESSAALDAMISDDGVVLSLDRTVHDVVMPMIQGVKAAIMLLAEKLDEMGA
jgi:hypothetical protein